jgi:hypothetical protein
MENVVCTNSLGTSGVIVVLVSPRRLVVFLHLNANPNSNPNHFAFCYEERGIAVGIHVMLAYFDRSAVVGPPF